MYCEGGFDTETVQAVDMDTIFTGRRPGSDWRTEQPVAGRLERFPGLPLPFFPLLSHFCFLFPPFNLGSSLPFDFIFYFLFPDDGRRFLLGVRCRRFDFRKCSFHAIFFLRTGNGAVLKRGLERSVLISQSNENYGASRNVQISPLSTIGIYLCSHRSEFKPFRENKTVFTWNDNMKTVGSISPLLVAFLCLHLQVTRPSPAILCFT